ncbi:unnamed protein product [Schistosoma turkestanicum]|nr:unnamed protein product [Schistosoma turkestanicum]
MSRESFVTLATNDEYCVGALVLAASLKQSETSKELTILVTPGVSSRMRQLLSNFYHNVIEVQPVTTKCWDKILTGNRTELAETFTKIQVWSLTQFTKIVFLDADTMVLQNIDELFDRCEFAAAPDPQWPDCFNAGVFVLEPSIDKYNDLLKMLSNCGSFDGREQGLLNQYFSNWLHNNDISHRLSYIYNCICRISNDTNIEFYTSRCAWVHYGQSIRVVHFSGSIKPWHKTSAAKTCSQMSFRTLFFNTEQDRRSTGRVASMLAYWWSLFLILVRPQLSPDMYLSHISLDKLRKYDWSDDNHDQLNVMKKAENSSHLFVQLYPSAHEEYLDSRVNSRQCNLLTPVDHLQSQLPYHPEFHDTNWDYLHRGQRIDEGNRLVEHHQINVEPSAQLPSQFNLSLSGITYHHEVNTRKNVSSCEKQSHQNNHECKQHEIAQNFSEKHLSNDKTHQSDHQTHQEKFVDHQQIQEKSDDSEIHHSAPPTTIQDDCDITENTSQYKEGPAVSKSKSDETVMKIPENVSSSFLNPVPLESTIESTSQSPYSLNCHKCCEKLVREQQRLICPVKMRKLSTDHNTDKRQTLRKHQRYSLGASFKPTAKILHPIQNNNHNRVKQTRNSMFNDGLKQAKLVKNHSSTLPLNCNLTSNYHHHQQVDKSDSNYPQNQLFELNRKLSNQYRGLDIAYSISKQCNRITTIPKATTTTTPTTTTTTTTVSQKKSHQITDKSYFCHKDLKRQRIHHGEISSLYKHSHSDDENSSRHFDHLHNKILKNSYSLNCLNQLKSTRLSPVDNNSVLVHNKVTLNPQEFHQTTLSQLKKIKSNKLKKQRKPLIQSNKQLFNSQLLQIDCVSNNVHHPSKSFTSMNSLMISTGLVGDLANMNNYADKAVLCQHHAELEAASNERMYAWERGEIDYTGADRFMNILNKLCNTLRDVGGEMNLPIGTDIMQ